jgi:hypothetical protein
MAGLSVWKAIVAVAGLCMGVAGCETSVCGEDGAREPGVLCLAVADARQSHWGFAPETLRWTDIDGDGMTDLVAASHARGTVSVVWGADATLGGVATTWSVAPEVAGIAVADVDGDGRVDLVTAVPGSDAVAVLHGEGGRRFAEATMIAVGSGPRAVIAVDLDGAGPPELVTVNAGDGTLGVVRAGVASLAVVGPGPRDVAAGDLDGDGDVDLAVALADRGALQVMLGDGAGLLSPGALHVVGAAPYAVVTADFDGDGAVDLASADALEGSVSVLFGDGAGGVRSRMAWPTLADPRGLVVLQRGKDLPDLAVLSHRTASVQTIDPRTGAGEQGAAALAPEALAAGDADGDGFSEVLYAGSGHLGALVAGVGVQLSPMWQAESTSSLFPVDVDGDGIDELVVPLYALDELPAEDEVPGKLALWREGVVDAEIDGGVGHVTHVAAADLDGDGRRDLIVAGDGMVVVLLQQADGTFRIGSELVLTSSVSALVVGDVGSDGGPDVVVGTLAGVEALSWQSDGLRSVATAPLEGVVRQILVVDADGDAHRDLVWVGSEGVIVREDLLDDGALREVDVDVMGAVRSMIVADLDADGGLDGVLCASYGLGFVSGVLGAAPGRPERLGEHGCDDVVLGDIDGDGRQEVLAMRQERDRVVLTPWVWAEDGWSAWASQGVSGGSTVQFARLDHDGVPDVLVVSRGVPVQAWRTGFGSGLLDLPLRRFGVASQLADLDGDGALDLFTYGSGVGVAFGDGDGGFGPMTQYSREEALAGATVNSAAVRDFDGDGDEEAVVMVRPMDDWTTQLRSLTIGRAMTVESETLASWSRPDTRVTPGDLDHDGTIDLVVFSPTLGLRLLRGAGDGGFAPPEAIGERLDGLFGGRVVDLDGDGRRDVLGSTLDGLMLYRGLGEGRLERPYVWWAAGLSNPERFALGDVDRDGRLDVAMVSSPFDHIALIAGAGATAAGAPRLVLEDVDLVALADLDGDGALELLAAGRGRHEPEGQASLYVGRGEGGRFSFTRETLAMAEPSGISAVDVDGDGRLEILLAGGGDVTIVRQVP